jgi:hypothetical protein
MNSEIYDASIQLKNIPIATMDVLLVMTVMKSWIIPRIVRSTGDIRYVQTSCT